MVYNEHALIGALLYNARDTADVFKAIDGNVFVDNQCGAVFDIMKKMFYVGEKIDIITVSDKIDMLKGANKYIESINAMDFVSRATDACPTSVNALNYLKAIENDYVKRKIAEVSSSIHLLVKNGGYESVLDLKNDAIKLLSDIRISDEKGIGSSFYDVLNVCVDDIVNKRNQSVEEQEKMYTTFDRLDRIMDGLHQQELTIIGARPAVGKTQFALAVAKKLAKKGNKILFFSREMGDKVLGNRFLSNITGIEGHRLRRSRCLSDEEVVQIIDAKNNIQKMRDLNVVFNTSAATIQEIRSVVRELYLKNELDVVMVDYLALVQAANHRGDRRSEVEYVSRQLKLISGDYNVPVVCLSQINRASANEGREPELRDLRETGAIEQDADNVIFLHVPTWVEDVNQPFLMKLIVAKQRNGPTGDVWLWNDRNHMDFYNPSEEDLSWIKNMESGGGSATNL